MFIGKIKSFLSISFLFVMISLVPSEVFARGGRGGGFGGGRSRFFSGGRGFSGGGSGSNITIDPTFFYVLILLIIIALIIIGLLIWRFRKKNKEAEDLTEQIKHYDTAWDPEDIKNHVTGTFYKFYEAKKQQNMDITKDYISESIYRSEKAQMHRVKSRNHKNIIQSATLKDLKIMGIGDYRENNKDYFWAYISGSMYNYFVNEYTREVISGNSTIKKNIKEMWKFTRSSDGWILDKIDKTILLELFKVKSFTEGYGNSSNNGYLMCEDCKGYYMLEGHEEPSDFDTCQCGGNLIYYNNIDKFLEDDLNTQKIS